MVFCELVSRSCTCCIFAYPSSSPSLSSSPGWMKNTMRVMSSLSVSCCTDTTVSLIKEILLIRIGLHLNSTILTNYNISSRFSLIKCPLLPSSTSISEARCTPYRDASTSWPLTQFNLLPLLCWHLALQQQTTFSTCSLPLCHLGQVEEAECCPCAGPYYQQACRH